MFKIVDVNQMRDTAHRLIIITKTHLKVLNYLVQARIKDGEGHIRFSSR